MTLRDKKDFFYFVVTYTTPINGCGLKRKKSASETALTVCCKIFLLVKKTRGRKKIYKPLLKK